MLLRIILILLVLKTTFAEADEKADINNVLDSLHKHAANASMKKYFSLYDDNAVFIGTDASETWSLDAFKAYAKPVFEDGRGWTYHPKTRHIYLATDKKTAWFDELLDSDSYGTTRGTGVLIATKNGWKVAQYHLAIPVPNPLAKEITSRIKAYSDKTLEK